MLPGARHTRTLSTSSSEGSLPSTELETRKVSRCWPGSWMVTFTISQGDIMKSPYAAMLKGMSTLVTSPEGGVTSTFTTCAESSKGSSSWPIQRTSAVSCVEASA